MAVGVAFASYLAGGLSLTAAYALAIGIAIQNFPEGSVVSFPLLKKGFSKRKAFMYGAISAIFELLGTLITLLFTNIVVVILPYMLSIAAGAMMYVIVIELIPESNDKSKLNVIGFLIGFIIMMLLDVMLG
jgi:ZIP family zinc transporter